MNVSIVIATYGEDHWRQLALDRAFPSAKNQGAHEILVGHDTDLTIGPVRNALAAKATGDWLCFLDADDELDVGYLAAMDSMNSGTTFYEGKHVLYTPAVMKVNKKRRTPPSFYPEVNLWQGNWLVIGTLIERDLFTRIGGFNDEPHGFEDWSCWSKATKAGAEVVKVPNAIYIQHINPHSKHRAAWRDHRWQVETHQRVEAELAAWTP